MLFVIGGELREVRFPEEIEDQEWNEIEIISGLPPEARSELNDYIGYCRQLREDSTRTFEDEWFDALKAASNAEKTSKKSLDDMISKSEFFDALAMGLDGQERMPAEELKSIRAWLERVSADKQRLLDWYQKAIDRVHHRRTGQKTGRLALAMLVSDINSCLVRHTGKRISTATSTLKLIVKLCVIAFPDLRMPDPKRKEKSRSKRDDRAFRRIKKIIEQVLKGYSMGDKWDEISQWQHLIPGWKPISSLQLHGDGIEIYFRSLGDYSGQLVVKSPPSRKGSALIFPMVPFASPEVRARQSRMKPPPDSVWNPK